MVVAGVLLIFAVLLDSFRRVRKERHSSVRMKLVDPADRDTSREVDLAWLKELPNGGARVINRNGVEAEVAEDEQGVEEHVEPQQVDVGAAPSSSTAGELVSGLSAAQEPENIDWLDALDTDSPSGRQQVRPATPESSRTPLQPEPEVFMFNVVARSAGGFNGGDILHILLACDLRFGDMDFFHRYEQEAGLGPIQFSVANMMQPGVFNLDCMSDMTTPGLVFFLTLPGPENMMQAFDYMLETAQAVARNLEGDVLDDSRSAMTSQALEHSRQKIRDLERRMLTQAQR